MTRPDEGRAQFIIPLDAFVLVDFGVCVSCVKHWPYQTGLNGFCRFISILNANFSPGLKLGNGYDKKIHQVYGEYR